MTREQAKKNLINLGVAEPTDEQITNYLNSVTSEVQKEKSKTEASKEELERLKAIEAEYEAEKEKTMTAEERAQKAEEEKQKAEAAAKSKEIEFAKRISRLSVEKILQGAGLTEEDYSEFVDGIVSEDEEVSKKRASALASTLSGKLTSQKESLEAGFEQWKMENTPNPGGGKGGAGAGASLAAEKAVAVAKRNSGANTDILANYISGGKK